MAKFGLISCLYFITAVVAAIEPVSAISGSNQVNKPEMVPTSQPTTKAVDPALQLAQLAGKATGKVIYRGAQLIHGVNSTQTAVVAILVQGERIQAIIPETQLDKKMLEGAEIVDVHGLYAVPGLIDSHVHYGTHPNRAFAQAQLKRDLYAGVTGVRDMAGDARLLADLSRAALVNEIPAPDIYYASLVAGPSFFEDPRTVTSSLGMRPGQAPWMFAVTEKTNLPYTLAQARGTGATGLKIYANLPGKLVQELIKEAKHQHFPVWTHLQVYPATPFDSIGATSVSHVCMLARYVAQPDKSSYDHRNPPSYEGIDVNNAEIKKYIAAISKSGTMLDATLSVYDITPDPAATPENEKKRCSIELAGALTQAMFKAGVPILAGTDENAAPDDTYPALNRELELLVRYAGLSAEEAIFTATRNAAIALGKQDEIGSIESGKYANFVFVKDDPSSDITHLRSVVLTVKRGLRYVRSDYHHQSIPDSDD